MSISTAHSDTSAKLIGYLKLPSVQHYLVIDPEARTIMRHSRAGGRTEARLATEGMLRLDPPGIEFDIAELFG